MHLEEWCYKRLSEGSEKACQTNGGKFGFSCWQLPSTPPLITLLKFSLFWVPHTGGGAGGPIRGANKIYYFRNYWRNEKKLILDKRHHQRTFFCCVKEEIHLLCEISVVWYNINRKILHASTPQNVYWVLRAR